MFFAGSRNRGARWKDEGGSPLPWRPFIDAVGSGITASDDAALARTLISVAGSSGGGGSPAGVVEVSGTNNFLADPGNVQAAITASQPSSVYGTDGKAVHFIGGTPFAMNAGPILIPRPNWSKFHGVNGIARFNKFISSDTGTMFKMYGEGVSGPHTALMTWEHIALLGNSSGPWNSHGLELRNIAWSTVRHSYFTGFDHGVHSGVITFYFENCWFFNNNYGLWITGENGADGPWTQASNLPCIYKSTFAENNVYGLYHERGNGLKVRDCNFEGNPGGGIYIASGHVDSPTVSVIDGCYFEANTGRDITIGSGTKMTVITGCGGNGTFSVEIQAGAGPVLIDGCVNPSIYNASGTSNVRVVNCKTIGSSTSNGSGSFTNLGNFA